MFPIKFYFINVSSFSRLYSFGNLRKAARSHGKRRTIPNSHEVGISLRIRTTIIRARSLAISNDVTPWFVKQFMHHWILKKEKKTHQGREPF